MKLAKTLHTAQHMSLCPMLQQYLRFLQLSSFDVLQEVGQQLQ